jgi:glucose-6-phosphate dehydrogenase assembly protein OpcA
MATAVVPLTWSAKDTSTDVIGDALRRLLHEAEHRDLEVGASNTLNLIIGPGDGHRIGAGVRSVHAIHPARTIVLHLHTEDRLDAKVVVDRVDLHSGGLRLLTERIDIHADRDRLLHAHSMLTPLLARGIPTVTWLPGDDDGALEEELAQTAHVTVIDSDRCTDPTHALAFADDLAGRHPVRDLAWLRTDPWRSRVANAFTVPEHAAALRTSRSARVEGDVGSPCVRLFAAWLAARADLDVEVVHRSGNEPIASVVVAGIPIAPDERVRCDHATLAEALDTVYNPPRGYEVSLAALGRIRLTT